MVWSEAACADRWTSLKPSRQSQASFKSGWSSKKWSQWYMCCCALLLWLISWNNDLTNNKVLKHARLIVLFFLIRPKNCCMKLTLGGKHIEKEDCKELPEVEKKPKEVIEKSLTLRRSTKRLKRKYWKWWGRNLDLPSVKLIKTICSFVWLVTRTLTL